MVIYGGQGWLITGKGRGVDNGACETSQYLSCYRVSISLTRVILAAQICKLFE